MSIIRPDLKHNPWIYDLIFAASSNMITTPEQFVGDPALNYDEFCECCHSVNLKVKKTVEVPLGSAQSFTPVSAFSRSVNRTREISKWLVYETQFEYILQFMLAIVSISAIICNSDKTKVSDDIIRLLEGSVAMLFSVAVLSSIAARGAKFWLKLSNQVTFIVMVSMLSLYGAVEFCDEVTYDQLDSALSMLYLVVVLRSILFIRFHPEVTSTIYSIRLILPMLLRVFVVFLSVMYAFIMVGTSLFEKSLYKNDSLEKTAYHNFHYDDINFSSFWSTFLLLYQCLLGPNFPVFIEGVAEAHGSWLIPLLYFGIYYVMVVVFVQNVVVAFILEAYISQRNKQNKEKLNKKVRER